MRNVIVGIVFGMAMGITFWETVVQAHPGRLDSDGCHHVYKEYIHRSGKIDSPGDFHCHRAKHGIPAEGIPMDGREQLSDPNHPDVYSPAEEEAEAEAAGKLKITK